MNIHQPYPGSPDDEKQEQAIYQKGHAVWMEETEDDWTKFPGPAPNEIGKTVKPEAVLMELAKNHVPV